MLIATLAAGSNSMMHKQHGVSLIEMLVVLVIVGTMSVMASANLFKSATRSIAQDAEILVNALEVARAQSRASGLPYTAKVNSSGFELRSPTTTQRIAWKSSGLSIKEAVLTLGPDPLLPAQSLTITNGTDSVLVQSDGVKPFVAQLK